MSVLRCLSVLLILLALIPSTAMAQGVPPDVADFSVQVADRLRLRLPEMPVLITRPLTLRVGVESSARQINLERLWAFCSWAKDRCDAATEDYALRIARLVRSGGQDSPPERADLRLVVRNSAWLQNLRRTHRADGKAALPDFISRPFVEGLEVVAVLDGPESLRYLTEDDLKTLGLGADEAMAVARDNLRRTLRPLSELANPAPARVVAQVGGDAYDSSRVLLHEDWQPLAQAQKGQLVVAVPAPDVLFYIADSDRKGREMLRQIAEDVASRAPGPMTDILLKWTPQGWDPVR